MYDDEFELTFNLSDEDPAPVELPKAPAEEAEPEKPEPPTPAPDEEPTIVVPELGRKPAAEPVPPEAADVPETPAVPEAPQQPEPAAVRCVLISGGDRGIGAAAARAFYKAGYRVAVLYHTNADAAAALEQELPGCIAVQCDVASRASCEVAFRAAEQALGRVDVLVSNAGIAQQKLFTDITPDEWQHMLDVNLSGAFHLCQLALPGMIRRKAGRILKENGMTFHYHNHSFEMEKTDGKMWFDIMIEESDPEVFFFILDVYWLQHGGLSPVEYINKLGKRIKVLHYKDMAIRNWKQSFASIGSGNLNWNDILSASLQNDIPYAMIEQDSDFIDDPISELERSFLFLKGKY